MGRRDVKETGRGGIEGGRGKKSEGRREKGREGGKGKEGEGGPQLLFD